MSPALPSMRDGHPFKRSLTICGGMPVREEVLNWLEEARADLRHAKVSLDVGDYNWACFAAQQAAEKGLRAAALHVAGLLPRGHDLTKLYWRLRRHVDLRLDETDLSKLSAYYTQARCPNAGIERPSLSITAKHGEEAVSIAEAVLNEVARVIRDP